MGLWDRKRETFGSAYKQRREIMSHNKPLKTRAILTVGAAALGLCVSNTPGFAAGHEGRAAGIAAIRGGGGAGEVRSVNERFGSMRVERLSPAGFVTPHVTPPQPIPTAPQPPIPIARHFVE